MSLSDVLFETALELRKGYEWYSKESWDYGEEILNRVRSVIDEMDNIRMLPGLDGGPEPPHTPICGPIWDIELSDEEMRRRPLTISTNGFEWTTIRSSKEPPDPEQVRLAAEYLRQFEPTEADEIAYPNSYGLKDTIERALGTYISNGATIQAALDIGLDVSPVPESLNAWIGVRR